MRFYRLLILMIPVLLFAGCALLGGNFNTYNASNSGILIEQFLPQDTWMVVSINTKDRSQVQSFNNFIGRFSQDDTEGDFWERVQDGFADLGLDYEQDIKPILGETGFRIVLAYAESESFVAMTVADTDKAQNWFDTLVEIGDASELELGDADIYVTVNGDQESYMALLGDVMIVTSDSTELMNAKGRFAADDSESLLDNELYRETTSKLKRPYVGYFYMDFNNLSADVEGILAAGSYLLDSEVMALGFEDDAVYLQGYGIGDEEKIDEVGLGLSDISGDGMYLAGMIPGDDLVFYEESGSLDGLVDLWVYKAAESGGVDSDQLYENVNLVMTQYLGMDFEEEVKVFLDQGYAIAVHREGTSVVPGVSLIMDVSSDVDGAEELLNRLDAQVSSLALMMEPAMSKSDNGDFYAVNVDLEAMGVVGTGTGALFSVPEGTNLASLQLLYGMTDDLFVISTYPGWELFNKKGSVKDLDLFKDLRKNIRGADDTVFFLDFDQISNYLDIWESLQESLSAGLESVLVEEAETVDWGSYLEVMDGAMFGASAGKYEVEMKGVLRLTSNE